MRKSVIGLLSISALLVLGAFQNCGKLGFSTGGTEKITGGGLASLFATHAGSGGVTAPSDGTPSLAVNSHPRDPRKGSVVVVTAIPQNLDAISYSCATSANPERIVASGALSDDEMMFKITVDADLVCTFKGSNAALNKTISVPFGIDVQCGAQTKTTAGACADVVCQSYQEIDLSRSNPIPARTADGVCFYAKLFDGVARGPSDPALPTDPDVVARNAEGPDPASRAPRTLAAWSGAFTLAGPRVIKLAGHPEHAEPIVVDDLLLIGLRQSDAAADVAADYRAFGTGLVTNLKDGHDTGAVLIKSVPVPVVKFTDDGVSSVTPVEVSSFVEVNNRQSLDLRALDTGGTGELSNVYLRFE